MGNIVLDMSMSLDGFITGPDDGPENGLGVDGNRLHSWLAEGDGADPNTYRPDGPSALVFDEMMATGAVLQLHVIPVLLGEGRRLFDHLGADHIELTRIIDAPGVTHLRSRVVH